MGVSRPPTEPRPSSAAEALTSYSWSGLEPTQVLLCAQNREAHEMGGVTQGDDAFGLWGNSLVAKWVFF